MRSDTFISFRLQAKVSRQQRIGPMFQDPVGDTFNAVYADFVAPFYFYRCVENSSSQGQGWHLHLREKTLEMPSSI
jgi:hypothetical protein